MKSSTLFFRSALISTTLIAHAIGQQIAVASYYDPSTDVDDWTRLIGYSNDKVTVVIANVENGPTTTVNSDWTNVISAAAAKGKTVLGYVRTGYLSFGDDTITTRVGSTDLADWVAQIERDVDFWYQLYPGNIDGIFFDEGWNSCGTDNVYAELYHFLSDNTKNRYPGAFTVINPGATMPECFEDSADTLMTFEGSYETYTDGYVANDWNATDSRKLWHIIYDVPQAEVDSVSALATQRGAGLLQVTNDDLPNPYDALPDDAYMQAFLDAVPGGEVLVGEPDALAGGPAASTPAGLTVTSVESTSVSLSWSAATDALGYRVYLDDVAALNLTATMTSVTIGDLDPETSSYTFQVTALGGDGSESAKSNSVSSGTATKGRKRYERQSRRRAPSGTR